MNYVDDTPEFGEFKYPYPKNSICINNLPVNKRRAKIIVFEGSDGSGKSTQIDILYQMLNKKNNVVKISYIKSKIISNLLLKFKWNNVDALSFTYLYLAALTHEINKVIYNSDDIIIFDRYIYTILAKFKEKGGNDSFINTIIDLYPKPDIIIYIDTPVEICIKRKEEMKSPITYWEAGADIYCDDNIRFSYDYENLKYSFRLHQTKMKEIILEFISPENTHIIDGSKSLNSVQENILKIIEKEL